MNKTSLIMSPITSVLIFMVGINMMPMTNTTAPSSDKREDTKTAKFIYEVYRAYRDQELKKCKVLMQDEAFNLTREKSNHIPNAVVIDSLVFENDELKRWAMFKSVDLEYVRNVEALIVIEDQNSQAILAQLEKLIMQNSHLKMAVQPTENGIRLTDVEGADVIDERFQEPTITRIPSLFDYELSVHGNYLMASFKEIVPAKVMVKTEVVVSAN